MSYDKKAEQIDKLVAGTEPAAFAAVLATRFARGQGYYITCGQIEAEARLARRDGDMERFTAIQTWINSVYEAEAAEAGVSPDTARYLMLRGHAVSRMLQAKGSSLYMSMRSGRTPYVGMRGLLLVMAVLQDEGPGELPATREEAQELVGANYGLSQPGYIRTLKSYMDGQASWGAVEKSHEAAVEAWLSTATDRQWLAEQLMAILNDVVDEARKDRPQAFAPGSDILTSFVATWVPEAADLLDTETETKVVVK